MIKVMKPLEKLFFLAVIFAVGLALALHFTGQSITDVALGAKPPTQGQGNGNGGKPKGGDNPCPPSQHGVYDKDGKLVGCEHNGDGGGNCGQNQSGKGDKPGNGGDKGYGNKDGCQAPDETTTTPTETTPTETTPTTPEETTPTCNDCPQPTVPTETTPTTPEQPPVVTPPTTAPVPGSSATPPVTKKQLQDELDKQAPKDNSPAAHPQAADELPYTGFPLWAIALIGAGLVGGGLALRRR